MRDACTLYVFGDAVPTARVRSLVHVVDRERHMREQQPPAHEPRVIMRVRGTCGSA